MVQALFDELLIDQNADTCKRVRQLMVSHSNSIINDRKPNRPK